MKKPAVIIITVIILCAAVYLLIGGNKTEKPAEVSTESETVSAEVQSETASAEAGSEAATEAKNEAETQSAKEEKEKTTAETGSQTTEAVTGKPVTMEVYFSSQTFRVNDSAKAGGVYEFLKSLKYEQVEDVKLEGGVGVYFYDSEGNESESFYIKDNYIKINGAPETYKITSEGFNYADLCNQIKQTANENLLQ